MQNLVKYDFKSKTKIDTEEFLQELSDIPEFNQLPDMNSVAKHDRAFSLETINKLILIYLDHKYLDPMNRTRTVLATLYYEMIVNQMESIGVSQVLVDKINDDAKKRK